MIQLVQTDHRRFVRTCPPRETDAVLTIGGRAYPSSVVDYSLGGVAVRVENGAIARLRVAAEGDVELDLADGKFLGRIRHTRGERFESVVGIDLRHEGGGEGVAFTNEDPGWDLIEDPETLATLFGDLSVKGAECPVDSRQIRFQGTFLPGKIENGVLTAVLFSTKRGNVETGTASFRFDIFQTCHAFDSRILRVEGNHVEIEIPARVARLLRRETFRVRNGDSGRTLSVKVESSFLGSHDHELRVHDYSEHGISIVDPTGWLAAPVGFRLEKISIGTAEGKTIRGSGVIRGYRWLAEEKEYAIGISLETATSEDRTEWHNAILSARYPTLSFDYREEDHAQIWDLFDRSGYLDLGDREAFSHVFDLTKDTWAKLSNAGTQISKRAMIRMENKVVGHLQMDRIYPETWCAHHLAIDPKISKVVGKELYSISADVLSAEGAHCILSITEADKPWNQRNYYDFVKQYRFPDHNEIKMYQFYEVDLKGDIRLRKHPNIELRLANKYDHRRIARYFEVYGSELERRALSLTAEDLDLHSFNESLSPHSLARGREFVVGMAGSQLVGFAAVETGTSGINLWNLVDMLYVHVVPGVPDHLAVYETLVAAGLERFQEIGRNHALALLDDNRASYYTEHGVKYVWEAVRWIAYCDVARRFHAYSQMLYGHLLLRRSSIRQKHAMK